MNERMRFVHRPNRDSSFDSICRECYQTIGHRKAEAELANDEIVHVCNMGHPYTVRQEGLEEIGWTASKES